LADARRPRALILSVFGVFLRRVDGWMSIAGLIDLMSEMGVEQQAVRSAISRLKRRDVVAPERRDGLAGYALSEQGKRILEAGDARIYGRRRVASLDDGWVLAAFSVPDAQRATRHVLRTQLAWLGFASFSPGLWLAPRHVTEEALATLRRLELDHYVHFFHAHYHAFADPTQVIASCWDLDTLAREYREFISVCRPMLEAWHPGAERNGRSAFVDEVRVVTAWRRLPFLDPGLPAEMLPAAWPGAEAWEVFHALIERVDRPALTHVREALARCAAGAAVAPGA
jgi:phenylacetic acid degradation operon negative regulatory protein